ncbi:hypothetical protein CV83915_04188 [Escherichia coli]|uniref:Uncharacterized protein n=1 Tax=Escherichia coli TaxID=562 RepID=A0A2H4TXU8_ECOLX|nr:hypothetical protein CV83915_04128 [Escherichia coli]ATZ34464.1 hypothetical protein CV83915_04188 [Escherichia coli]
MICALTELAECYPWYGFKKLFQLLLVRNPAPLMTSRALNQS